MGFNSLSFFIFFPVVVIAYYAMAPKVRPLMMLAASCYFYMAFIPKYILILIFLIVTDFFLAQAMEQFQGRKRTILLLLSIAANIGTLFFFKYFNFFNENVATIAQFLHWNYPLVILGVALPLGLSFHVFQSLSYVIEVYWGRYRAEKNILTYALYVLFFPQLVAGPIERPAHLLPQLKASHAFDPDSVRRGLERMLWGFFKKVVIADNLASYATPVFSHPHEYSGLAFIAATVFFAFQVYGDFSGYSDIAVGSARVLGYDLTVNFDRPFLAPSIAEFWRRWHISLSNWLRDYVYYPLALWKKGNLQIRIAGAALITFLLNGLWHGAAWTYVAFGGIHGVYIVLGQVTERWRKRSAELLKLSRFPRLSHGISVIITFALVCSGFIFFRAASFSDSLFILRSAIVSVGSSIAAVATSLMEFSLNPLREIVSSAFAPTGKLHLFLYIAIVAAFVVVEIADSRFDLARRIHGSAGWIRYLLYALSVLAVLNLGVTHEIRFIYFQF